MEEYSNTQSRKRTHSSSDEDTPELNNENSNNIDQSGKHPKRKLESSNVIKEDARYVQTLHLYFGTAGHES